MHRRLPTYAWWVLAANLAVILWGALVRATGSGAGCGSHWPLCDGEVIPSGGDAGTWIEYSHRATSGVVLLAVVALVAWVFRACPRRHPARKGALLSLLFMLGEAAVGAGLVLFELVADDASMARALLMAAHLVNTFLLLAALLLTARWLSGAPPLAWRGGSRPARLVVLCLLGTLLIGASGAVAALGDTLFPADGLREALAQDLSPTAHVLVRLRTLHPLIAVVVGLLILYTVSAVRAESSAQARASANWLNLLVFAQIGIGALNVALLAPIWVQLLHLLLADVLWLVLVSTGAAVLASSGEAVEAAEPALAAS